MSPKAIKGFTFLTQMNIPELNQQMHESKFTSVVVSLVLKGGMKQ